MNKMIFHYLTIVTTATLVMSTIHLITNEVEFINKLNQLLTDDVLCKKFSKNAKKVAENYYPKKISENWSKILDRYI